MNRRHKKLQFGQYTLPTNTFSVTDYTCTRRKSISNQATLIGHNFNYFDSHAYMITVGAY